MMPPSPQPSGYSDRNARLILIAAVAAVVITAVGVLGVGLVLAAAHSSPGGTARATPRPSPTPTAAPITLTTPITVATGSVVFTDDFHDSLSGWDTSPGSGVKYSFVGGALEAMATGAFFFYETSPYEEPKQQLSVGATATLDIHTPPDAGFGVDCIRGSGSSQIRYEFDADADSNWYVNRIIGPDSDTNFPAILKQGSLGSSPAPGVLPVTLVAVCATMADGLTTRLALFVDGTKVADITDTAPTRSADGWVTDLVTSGSESGPVTVTVTHFEERDLSRSGP